MKVEKQIVWELNEKSVKIASAKLNWPRPSTPKRRYTLFFVATLALVIRTPYIASHNIRACLKRDRRHWHVAFRANALGDGHRRAHDGCNCVHRVHPASRADHPSKRARDVATLRTSTVVLHLNGMLTEY